MPRIDVGRLTQEETIELFKELWDVIPDDELMAILSERLTMDQIDELQARLP